LETESFIASGILERYFLGECSESEIDLVEKLLQENSTIQQEYVEIQQAFQRVAMENAIQPNEALQTQIWNAINAESTSEVTLKPHSEKNQKSISWLAYAATFTLLFSVSSLAIYFFSELNSSQKTMASNLQKMEDLKAQILKTKDSLNQFESNLQLIADPSTLKVDLTGVPASKDSHAVVFWNQNKKQVILAGIDLPKSPENKQYQLWALVDGVPVDAGVFDTKSSHDLISMKSIEKSQAFAITLEPKGGSPTPHLEALCVIGNV
jgi:uncharacterized membrane protein YdfJ with MMPL/SSD domain